MMTDEQVRAAKASIDEMTQMGMAELWRNAPAGHPYFDTRLPLWEYFDERFTQLGRFSPAISKAIG